ncbi:CamS family sex pheromone protein [Salisediminibacterium halotolerans]|uniref:CamS family sex pheromone protein n=1 Tax=Salisediminibacterium halotolerans TaxID=517425 RepID=UPI000EB21136|nr:CamS family sex pheromone protein [Salisediminibacterium halotolerans]RLJ71778.1 protein involved in sex pheromone biosynthesis [Actinophytocola xinjiangensis]RPE86928.1 protein involved in sex pheromone biosynthesis [Salisediminibacterium halotolerans]TWG32991.1 protein involved in sex pheromone biosynthesis [Salisediminibacterium halotolerans]GEL08538.1 hypothetical protein SHA02_19540 [Salisediminibacterium halotolerans]
MKKITGTVFFFAAGLAVLTGCAPDVNQANEEENEDDVIVVEETEEEEEEPEYRVTPTIDSPDDFYRNVLRDGTYERSEARGNVAHAMGNRIDIDQFEMGLMEIATDRFSPDDYYFSEGTFLSGNEINYWLRRQADEEGYEFGLNPSLGDGDDQEEQMRDQPLVISHIMEHNYYSGNGDDDVSLSGIVLGVSIRSVYYFQTEDDDGGLYFHEENVDENYADEHAEQAAQVMVERMRAKEGAEEVPIQVVFYREEERGAVAPGSFYQMADVPEGETEITEWEAISEEQLVFPSAEAREKDANLSANFTQFTEGIDEFYGRTVGVIGNGRYKDGNLDQMVIDINLQSPGQAEVIALAQFIAGELEDTLNAQVPVHLYLNSVNGSEGIVIHHPGQEPYIHINRS